jgi:hypothetical protein
MLRGLPPTSIASPASICAAFNVGVITAFVPSEAVNNVVQVANKFGSVEAIVRLFFVVPVE